MRYYLLATTTLYELSIHMNEDGPYIKHYACTCIGGCENQVSTPLALCDDCDGKCVSCCDDSEVVVVTVTFTTNSPVSQQVGLEFWRVGQSFKSIPGPKHYKWISHEVKVKSITGVLSGAATLVEIVLYNYGFECIEMTLKADRKNNEQTKQ